MIMTFETKRSQKSGLGVQFGIFALKPLLKLDFCK